MIYLPSKYVGSKFTLRLIKEKTKTYPITRGGARGGECGSDNEHLMV